jgi:hypothetical protein
MPELGDQRAVQVVSPQQQENAHHQQCDANDSMHKVSGLRTSSWAKTGKKAIAPGG